MEKNRIGILIIVTILSIIVVYAFSSIFEIGDDLKTENVTIENETVDNISIIKDIDNNISESFTNLTVLKTSNDCYGGIAGTENNPPTGSVIDDNLSKYYNMPTAIGNGDIYWHISGWWFNLSQMLTLPSESHTYKVSPCAINPGGSEHMPISPIPEISTLILMSTGLMYLFLKKRYNTH